MSDNYTANVTAGKQNLVGGSTMKKRICLLFLSLILVLSLLPAYGVFAKELYDRPFGFTNKATSGNNDQPLRMTNTTDTLMLYILLKATLTGRYGLSVPAVIFKMGTITSAATSIMSA